MVDGVIKGKIICVKIKLINIMKDVINNKLLWYLNVCFFVMINGNVSVIESEIVLWILYIVIINV